MQDSQPLEPCSSPVLISFYLRCFDGVLPYLCDQSHSSIPIHHFTTYPRRENPQSSWFFYTVLSCKNERVYRIHQNFKLSPLESISLATSVYHTGPSILATLLLYSHPLPRSSSPKHAVPNEREGSSIVRSSMYLRLSQRSMECPYSTGQIYIASVQYRNAFIGPWSIRS